MADRVHLVYAAGILVLLTAGIHLVLGLGELFAAFTGDGTLAYGVLLTLGGLAALALVVGYATGVTSPFASYTLGCGLMLVYVFAYVDVHGLGYLESLTGAELHNDHNGHNGHDHNGHNSHDHNGHNSHDHNGHNSHDHNGHNSHDHNGHDHNGHDHNDHDHNDHDHGDDTLETVADHLLEDTVALVTKLTEVSAAMVLAVLAATERGR